MVDVFVIGVGGQHVIGKVLFKSDFFLGSNLNVEFVPLSSSYLMASVVNVWNGEDSCRLDSYFDTFFSEFVGVEEGVRTAVVAPENALLFGELVKRFPSAKFVVWSVNPWDYVSFKNPTHNLAKFMVTDEFTNPLDSWLFQWNYIRSVIDDNPDLDVAVFKQEAYIQEQSIEALRLGKFLGCRIREIDFSGVSPYRVSKWVLPKKCDVVGGWLGYY